MKVYRNTKEIKKKEQVGRRFSMTALGVLFAGMIISFVPTFFPAEAPPTDPWGAFFYTWSPILSLLMLFAGMVTASVGSYYVNRYARRRWTGSRFFERPDEVLERNMKGFDDKYGYFAHSLAAPYVLAGPNGVTVMTLRGDKGKVEVKGDKWSEPFSIMRIFTVFARESVGNPTKDLNEQKAQVAALLQQAEGDLAAALAGVPIDGAVVFLDPGMQLTLTGPTVPVLRADQVKDYMRNRSKEVKLTGATVRALTEYLAEKAVYQVEKVEKPEKTEKPEKE